MTKLVRTAVALFAALLCGLLAFVVASPSADASINTNSSTPAPTTVVANCCEADVKLLGEATTSASAVWLTTPPPTLAPGVHRRLPSFGVAAEGATTGDAVLSGILRDAAKGKGNFGLGSGTSAEAGAAGRAWVGDGYTVASDGKTLISSDGLRQFRPPSYKPNLDKWQANFEERFGPGQWQSNGHLDIWDLP